LPGTPAHPGKNGTENGDRHQEDQKQHKQLPATKPQRP